MDKPSGPRQPDKRHAAYESIFGRPSASHHQLPPPTNGLNYSQPLLPQANQPYIYQQHQQYQASNPSRRASYAPSFASSVHPQLAYPSHQQGPPSTYRQSYYPPALPPGPPPHLYPQHIQASQRPPSLAPPPSTHSHSRSGSSNNHSPGVIVPQPEEPPDATLEALTQTGLTPAQAYQAQVYLNSPSGLQGDRNRHDQSNGSFGRPSLPQGYDEDPSRTPDPPRLGISLESDDGRLGIDFGGSSNSSEQGTDDGSSDLPWARKERPASKGHHQHTQNSHSNPPPLRIHQATPPHRLSSASDHSSQSSPPSTYASRPYNLHLDTRPTSSKSSVNSISPLSSTLLDSSSPNVIDPSSKASHRRSSESARTAPSGPRRERTAQDRSMSMSAATTPMRLALEQKTRSSRPPIPPLQEGRGSPNSLRIPAPRKTPVVYAALLSRVAEALRDRIPIADRVKDGLTYKDAFDGREAVDKIAYIIKTTDRNLALLLGRALDAQKFFHDVTYDHRLRDSANELYQFRTKLRSPFVSGELTSAENAVSDDEGTPSRSAARRKTGASTMAGHSGDSDEKENGSASTSPSGSVQPHGRSRRRSMSSDEISLPSGVFTLLTECYSPTCSRDQLCYSIACPRRLEQQHRLNLKPQPGLSKQISRESLGDVPDDGTLWIHSVPQEIVNTLSDAEKKQQEAINEVIYTERDFVRDMEYLRDVWINRLKESDIIPQARRTDFLEQVFWNIHNIIAVNTRLRDALNKRQKQYAVVDRIGDIFLEHVPNFGPFVSYGAHQLYGKYEFEKEKNSNPAFAQFVEATERLPESRKLELNAYLTKPTTRLARYPLLLEAVLKHTPESSPDKTTLPQVIAIVRDFLGKVNTESGRTENRFNLVQLDQQLTFRPGEAVNLRLNEEGRELVYKSPLNKRDGELQVYLFDHALVFAKPVKIKQHDMFKVYRPPIPLELLLISAPDEAQNNNATIRLQGTRSRQTLAKKPSMSNARGSPHVPAVPFKPDPKGQYWITFIHLGRKYYHITLWASTLLSQRKWIENITRQQTAMRDRSMIFDTVTLSEGFFAGSNKVNCAVPYDGGRRVVYGTNDGVYISDLRELNREPVKVLALLDVLQVDVLEDYQLLIVLSERQVITFPLDALDPLDPMSGLKRAKRISSHTSFFKAGFCLGKVLVCIVKSSQLSSTFKTLEPIDQTIRGRNKPTFRKLLQGGNDTLKLFREFYIPVESTSIHYLKTRMCVGCSRGFEIVDLESLDTQGLLDPNDESLDFVRKKENLRPMAIYRIGHEFLLCYDEFAFYVNKNGRRSRKDFIIHWEGLPTGFALHEPYVLAFEPSFVEIRHIETTLMSQVIQGSNLRLLFADTPPSVSSVPNPMQYAGYPAGYNYNAAPSAYGGRTSMQSGHYPPHMPYPTQQPRNPQGVGRDEILMVSDDRILSLRTALGPQRFMSDNASMMSIPR